MAVGAVTVKTAQERVPPGTPTPLPDAGAPRYAASWMHLVRPDAVLFHQVANALTCRCEGVLRMGMVAEPRGMLLGLVLVGIVVWEEPEVS